MGALQQISYPLATPCNATAILLIKEEDIIKYATEVNGIYQFVIDNTLQIMADDIEFRLDYPIIILAKRKRITDNGTAPSLHLPGKAANRGLSHQKRQSYIQKMNDITNST